MASSHCGIFGGTFDPIHRGHTGAARQIIGLAGLDQIRVIPAAIPPHRNEPHATARQRLDMVHIALEDETAFVADPRELSREGRSYTVDTLTELQEEMPGTRFSLILGVDAALGLDQWHRWRDLLDLINVIVMVRPGWVLPEPLPAWWHAAEGAPAAGSTGKMHLMAIKPLDISATRIRTALRAGKDVRPLLHPGVYDYIRRNRLYSQPAHTNQ